MKCHLPDLSSSSSLCQSAAAADWGCPPLGSRSSCSTDCRHFHSAELRKWATLKYFLAARADLLLASRPPSDAAERSWSGSVWWCSRSEQAARDRGAVCYPMAPELFAKGSTVPPECHWRSREVSHVACSKTRCSTATAWAGGSILVGCCCCAVGCSIASEVGWLRLG